MAAVQCSVIDTNHHPVTVTIQSCDQLQYLLFVGRSSRKQNAAADTETRHIFWGSFVKQDRSRRGIIG